MDPLFWIASGVVVGCIIMIPILWRLEVQAERRAAAGRQKTAGESAEVKIVDPRVVLEEMDTRPIPAMLPTRPAQERPAKAAARPAGPAHEAPTRNEPLERATHKSASAANTMPLPGIQVRPTPDAALDGLADEAQAIQASSPVGLRSPDQSAEPARLFVPPPGQPDEPARPSEPLPSADQPTQKLPANPQASLNGRQASKPPRPAPTTRPLPARETPAPEAPTTAPPKPPRAAGFRRHSLARVEPAGSHQPAPGAPGTSETST